MENAKIIDLVKKISEERNEIAFSEIFDFIAPKINAYYIKNNLGIEQAEELTQEVLSTIWLKADLFDPKKSKFITWSFTIARNKKIDFYRKNKKNDINEEDVRDFLYENNKTLKGITKSLVSSIDIAPTILELANQKKGSTYQGRSFKKILLNPDIPFRNYVFAEHNWHDFESYERMVRSEQFMYIENKRNQFAQRGPLDAINSDSYASLLEQLDSGGISEIQKEIFISPREKEEFYEIDKDIFQRKNLIHNQSYSNEINQLKNVLEQWKKETGDTEPKQITKDWYERRPGPKAKIKVVENDLPKGGKYSLTTPFYGKRGELPGASKKATKINNKGPF